jgi:redox-sensing transcriptional repressor
VAAFVRKIDELLGAGAGRSVALAGIGHLGQALMAYFNRRGSQLTIAAAFDTDPQKAGRVLHGCHCFPLAAAAEVLRERRLRMAILAVPEAAAQPVAEQLVSAGVTGLLNFAPARLTLPVDVYVENVDIAILVEKVAFFARAPRAIEGVGS